MFCWNDRKWIESFAYRSTYESILVHSFNLFLAKSIHSIVLLKLDALGFLLTDFSCF